MSEQFTIERRGHKIEVESDESLIIAARVRLFIDERLADERSTLWEVRLHGELPNDGGKTIPIKVEVEFGFLGGVEECVLIEDGAKYTMREEKRKPLEQRPEPAPPKPDKESELLAATKENGGRITSIKAATETSLTVREADEMLSELASDGYLLVEPNGGAMIYALPGNEPENEGQ